MLGHHSRRTGPHRVDPLPLGVVELEAGLLAADTAMHLMISLASGLGGSAAGPVAGKGGIRQAEAPGLDRNQIRPAPGGQVGMRGGDCPETGTGALAAELLAC
jgi:hypothetical protein